MRARSAIRPAPPSGLADAITMLLRQRCRRSPTSATVAHDVEVLPLDVADLSRIEMVHDAGHERWPTRPTATCCEAAAVTRLRLVGNRTVDDRLPGPGLGRQSGFRPARSRRARAGTAGSSRVGPRSSAVQLRRAREHLRRVERAVVGERARDAARAAAGSPPSTSAGAASSAGISSRSSRGGGKYSSSSVTRTALDAARRRELRDHRVDELLGRARAGGHADDPRVAERGEVELVGPVDAQHDRAAGVGAQPW